MATETQLNQFIKQNGIQWLHLSFAKGPPPDGYLGGTTIKATTCGDALKQAKEWGLYPKDTTSVRFLAIHPTQEPFPEEKYKLITKKDFTPKRDMISINDPDYEQYEEISKLITCQIEV